MSRGGHCCKVDVLNSMVHFGVSMCVSIGYWARELDRVCDEWQKLVQPKYVSHVVIAVSENYESCWVLESFGFFGSTRPQFCKNTLNTARCEYFTILCPELEHADQRQVHRGLGSPTIPRILPSLGSPLKRVEYGTYVQATLTKGEPWDGVVGEPWQKDFSWACSKAYSGKGNLKAANPKLASPNLKPYVGKNQALHPMKPQALQPRPPNWLWAISWQGWPLGYRICSHILKYVPT